jgi:peptidoglycan hydrolase-like protein with peptidoglycan-binding domain
MANPGQPTIALGATGEAVRRVERALRRTPERGTRGRVVTSLQTLLTNGAPGQWVTTPQGIDGNFGPHTLAAVEAFQAWDGVPADGIVGDETWSVSLHAASATLETAVGLGIQLR